VNNWSGMVLLETIMNKEPISRSLIQNKITLRSWKKHIAGYNILRFHNCKIILGQNIISGNCLNRNLS
jgi:hypothetical protein